MESLFTVTDLLNQIRLQSPNPKALSHMENGEWKSLSTETMLHDIKYFALGLRALGLKPEDRIGLLAYPSPFWTISDLAIIIAGGVTVPLFANISDDNFVFEVPQT